MRTRSERQRLRRIRRLHRERDRLVARAARLDHRYAFDCPAFRGRTASERLRADLQVQITATRVQLERVENDLVELGAPPANRRSG